MIIMMCFMNMMMKHVYVAITVMIVMLMHELVYNYDSHVKMKS